MSKWHQEVESSVLKMLLGEENHSSPVVYRGGMVLLPYTCLSDTLTLFFPLDSFILASLENVVLHV